MSDKLLRYITERAIEHDISPDFLIDVFNYSFNHSINEKSEPWFHAEGIHRANHQFALQTINSLLSRLNETTDYPPPSIKYTQWIQNSYPAFAARYGDSALKILNACAWTEYNKLRFRKLDESHLIEGWHRHRPHEYSAEISDMSGHLQTTNRSVRCPECKGDLGVDLKLANAKTHHDNDGDVTHWEGDCPHCKKAHLTIFNDSYEPTGNLISEKLDMRHVIAKICDKLTGLPPDYKEIQHKRYLNNVADYAHNKSVKDAVNAQIRARKQKRDDTVRANRASRLSLATEDTNLLGEKVSKPRHFTSDQRIQWIRAVQNKKGSIKGSVKSSQGLKNDKVIGEYDLEHGGWVQEETNQINEEIMNTRSLLIEKFKSKKDKSADKDEKKSAFGQKKAEKNTKEKVNKKDSELSKDDKKSSNNLKKSDDNTDKNTAKSKIVDDKGDITNMMNSKDDKKAEEAATQRTVVVINPTMADLRRMQQNEAKMIKEQLEILQLKLDRARRYANINEGRDGHSKMQIRILENKIRQLKSELNESEQITELSKKTLGSYSDKAVKDLGKKEFYVGADAIRRDPTDDSTQAKNYLKNRDRGVKNRYKGISRAIHKLTKEESEQIDELSKKTLSTYIKVAHADGVNRERKADKLIHSGGGEKMNDPVYREKLLNRISSEKTKAARRQRGINKAATKLATEQSLTEGTMATGIFDRDPNKAKAAIVGLRNLMKKPILAPTAVKKLSPFVFDDYLFDRIADAYRPEDSNYKTADIRHVFAETLEKLIKEAETDIKKKLNEGVSNSRPKLPRVHGPRARAQARDGRAFDKEWVKNRIGELAAKESDLVKSNNNGSNDHHLYNTRKELDTLRLRAKKMRITEGYSTARISKKSVNESEQIDELHGKGQLEKLKQDNRTAADKEFTKGDYVKANLHNNKAEHANALIRIRNNKLVRKTSGPLDNKVRPSQSSDLYRGGRKQNELIRAKFGKNANTETATDTLVRNYPRYLKGIKNIKKHDRDLSSIGYKDFPISNSEKKEARNKIENKKTWDALKKESIDQLDEAKHIEYKGHVIKPHYGDYRVYKNGRELKHMYSFSLKDAKDAIDFNEGTANVEREEGPVQKK